jgi:hypothetical protein
VPKKRSIFTSKTSEKKKGLSLYKHDWHTNPDEREEFKQQVMQRAIFGASQSAKG